MTDMASLPALPAAPGNSQDSNSVAGSVKSALGVANKPVTDELESSEATFVDFLQGLLQPETNGLQAAEIAGGGNMLPLSGQLPDPAASSSQSLQAQLTNLADSKLLPAAGLTPAQAGAADALVNANDATVTRSASALSAEAIAKSMHANTNLPPGLNNGSNSTSTTAKLATTPVTGNTAPVETSAFPIESLQQLRTPATSASQLIGLAAGRQGVENSAQASTLITDNINASLLRSPLPQTSMSTDHTVTPSTPTITESFGRPEWNQGLGRQIMWMVNQNMQSAEIRLNPANLGPIEVRISMDDEKVNVAFSSRHAAVREAVEMALPRLREMFESSGINLADANISQHSFAEQREQQLREENNAMARITTDTATEDESIRAETESGADDSLDDNPRSMIDYYI